MNQEEQLREIWGDRFGALQEFTEAANKLLEVNGGLAFLFTAEETADEEGFRAPLSVGRRGGFDLSRDEIMNLASVMYVEMNNLIAQLADLVVSTEHGGKVVSMGEYQQLRYQVMQKIQEMGQSRMVQMAQGQNMPDSFEKYITKPSQDEVDLRELRDKRNEG